MEKLAARNRQLVGKISHLKSSYPDLQKKVTAQQTLAATNEELRTKVASSDRRVAELQAAIAILTEEKRELLFQNELLVQKDCETTRALVTSKEEHAKILDRLEREHAQLTKARRAKK
jgi:hypothetical protein